MSSTKVTDAPLQHYTVQNDAATIPLTTAYKTLGDRSKPCILISTCFGGLIDGTLAAFVGEGKVIDPKRYFVVMVGLFGGSESTSPSNSPSKTQFPELSYAHNVRNSKALLDNLGVRRLFSVVGFSMGGQVAYHWAALYPEFVDSIVVLCSLAKTTLYNQLFHDSLILAVRGHRAFNGGKYTPEGDLEMRKVFGRIYAPYCQGSVFFNQQVYRDLGFDTVEDYLEKNWVPGHTTLDLLAMLATWRPGSIASHGQSLEQALGNIKARCLIMPGSTDTYFRPEDSEREFKHLPKGNKSRHIIIESVHGHRAGSGNSVDPDNRFVAEHMSDFFAELQRDQP